MDGGHPGRERRPRRAGPAAGALVAVLLAASGCSTPGPTDGAGASHPSPSSPIPAPPQSRTSPYWVNPDTPAASAAAELRRTGREAEARLIDTIARQPVAEWIGVEDPEAETRAVTRGAAAADREALLVLYDIPHRDCGQYSRGGAADAAGYRTWLDGVVRGIGDRRTTVVLEPDALAHVEDGCTPASLHEERYALLAEAVGRLKGLPAVTVYLDAGNPSWITDPARMVAPLRRAGVGKADGFALNTANYRTTRASTRYGRELSRLLGGTHFVIDSSRNGNGPLTGGDTQAWCNPPGRALGEPPTTRTGDDLVDAYVWIKRPGESDGTCRGGPRAGVWWTEYALGLARGAR